MMKNGFFFFVGLLAAFVLGWGGVSLLAHKQLGSLVPFYDDGESSSFPARPPGIAARGQLVYADLGCASCHTQQVRRPDFGSDKARGWGDRQTVARDYIFQLRPQLGESRVGPDLANLGARKPPLDAAAVARFLYTGVVSGTKDVRHPPFPFLFEDRPIYSGKSADADAGLIAKTPGRQIVPTERARTLIAYLQSLSASYEFPEARPVAPVAAKEGAHK